MKIQEVLKVVKLQDNYTEYASLLKTFNCKKLPYLEHVIKNKSINEDKKANSKYYLILDKTDNSLFGVFSLSSHSFLVNYYDDRGMVILKNHEPSILIDNYALNDKRKKYQIDDFSNTTQAIFSEFVFNIIQDIKESIGIKYISLFAADISNTKSMEDKKLVNIYKSVGFILPGRNVDCLTPSYDEGCIFMVAKI